MAWYDVGCLIDAQDLWTFEESRSLYPPGCSGMLHNVPILEHDGQRRKALEEARAKVHSAQSQGRATMVVCIRGASRSPLVVAGLFMHMFGIKPRATMAAIGEVRHVCGAFSQSNFSPASCCEPSAGCVRA